MGSVLKETTYKLVVQRDSNVSLTTYGQASNNANERERRSKLVRAISMDFVRIFPADSRAVVSGSC
jgi:hypothetical protein